MNIPIYPSKLFSTTMFDKFFYLNFFNNYSENDTFLEKYFFKKNILKIYHLKKINLTYF